MIPTLIAGQAGLRQAPPDPYWNNVVSLFNAHGVNNSTTVRDEKDKTWTTFGNLKIDTSQGFQAALLDGTSDYATTPSNADYNFGSGEFTVEAIVRGATFADADNHGIICRDSIGATRGWLLFSRDTDDAPRFAAFVGGTGYGAGDTTALVAGTIYHLAGVRDQSSGDNIRMYKNGVQTGSTAITGSVGAPATPMVLGTLWALTGPNLAGNSWNGRILATRVTKGICRYPGGTTFTPPSAPFPAFGP